MSKNKKASKGWTEERRQKQAERCRRNKPWGKSTGPKTAAGKVRSSMNAYKHGDRSELLKSYRRLFYHHAQCLTTVLEIDKIELMKMTEKQSLIFSRAKKCETK